MHPIEKLCLGVDVYMHRHVINNSNTKDYSNIFLSFTISQALCFTLTIAFNIYGIPTGVVRYLLHLITKEAGLDTDVYTARKWQSKNSN